MAKQTEQAPLAQQPRAITPEIALKPETIRAGIRITLQKFGDHKRDEQAGQLSLLDSFQELERQEIEVTGLDLSVAEDRAFHALQVLLDHTDYNGNLPSEEIYSEDFQWTGRLPRLAITHSDFFEAYGLSRMGDGSFYGHQAEEALEALKSLEKHRSVYYTRKKYIGEGKARRASYDVIKTNKPLIEIKKGWQDLTEAERDQVLAGQENIAGRTTRLLIEFSPLWTDGIESFYFLKPAALHSEIRQLLGSRRHSKAVPLFIEWLLTLNRSPWKVGKELLAERLRLDSLIRQRKASQLDKRLTEAFETAKELGFLISWQEEPSGMLIFDLNPERCHRLKAKGEEPE